MIKLDYHLTREEWGKLLHPWVISIQSFARLAGKEESFNIKLKKRKDGKTEIISFSSGLPKNIYKILSHRKRILQVLLFSCAKLKSVPTFLKTLYYYAEKDTNNKSLLAHVFSYEHFNEGLTLTWEKDNNNNEIISKSKNCNNSWSKNKLCELLNVHTCVYCNLEYVSNVNSEVSCCKLLEPKDKKIAGTFTSPQDLLLKGKEYKIISETKPYHLSLDHILSQDEYPFFSISPYNLVPVCARCNSRKNKTIFPYSYYLYPYEDSFHDIAHFEFYFTHVDCLSNPTPQKLLVNLYPDKKFTNQDPNFIRAEHTCDFFGLKKRISLGHADYLCEILEKCMIYNEEYINNLQHDFGISYKDALRLIFGNYVSPEDINKRPLAKITIDMILLYKNLLGLNYEDIKDFYPNWE